MSAEAVNDRAKLLLHRLVARGLAREPGLIEAARSRLDPSADAPDHVREWEELLRLEPALIRRALVSRSERMTRLRLSSPFYGGCGLQDPAFRRRVWRVARRGFVRPPIRRGGGVPWLDVCLSRTHFLWAFRCLFPALPLARGVSARLTYPRNREDAPRREPSSCMRGSRPVRPSAHPRARLRGPDPDPGLEELGPELYVRSGHPAPRGGERRFGIGRNVLLGEPTAIYGATQAWAETSYVGFTDAQSLYYDQQIVDCKDATGTGGELGVARLSEITLQILHRME